MEVNTGAILAMASYPSFEPQAFVGGIDVDTFGELSQNFAFNNLVIQGLKPPSSTFKAVTYVTALEERIFPEGISSAEESIECLAQLEADFVDQSQLVWKNWTFPDSDGHQNLHDAFRRSCNIYFWEIALSIWRESREVPELENVLQDWARELGFGRRTQVDLPFENQGIMPDRQLFEDWKANQEWRVRPEGWLGGDLMNLAVGQGSVLATPIQVATAYAAMVNGGNRLSASCGSIASKAPTERLCAPSIRERYGPRISTPQPSPSFAMTCRRLFRPVRPGVRSRRSVRSPTRSGARRAPPRDLPITMALFTTPPPGSLV